MVSGVFIYFDQLFVDVSFLFIVFNYNGSCMVNYYDGFDKLMNLSLQVEYLGSLLNWLVNISVIIWL